MYDLLRLSQGDPLHQTHVTELAFRGIQNIIPSLHSEKKDSVSLKKALAVNGN